MVPLSTISSDDVLNAAYAWLCKQRRHWTVDVDIWWLRFHWLTEKPRIQAMLRHGDYCSEPLSRVTKADGETIHLWSARDALVLKAMANVLGNHLPVSRRCVHVKGHGGAKAAVRAVRYQLLAYSFVSRTDVKSYYESSDQHLIMDMLAKHIKDWGVLRLLWHVLRRTVTLRGLYWDCKRGISRNCPLSPLLGAVFLNARDAAMEKLGLFYVRFMDDVLVLSPTRWKRKRAVKQLNEVFAGLKLEKHPDKTFIGRIERGFDFLGYRFSRYGLTVAKDTLEKFVGCAGPAS